MDFTDFHTGKDDQGRRLDKVIRIIVPQAQLSNIYQIIRKGLVKVNGKKSKPEYRIAEDDVISVADILLENGQKAENSENPQTDYEQIQKLIVFENENLLVLNKPQGINVQKAKKDEISLTELVEAYYKSSRSGQSLSFKPGPLHRLDKMTSGLVCFSMSLEGARWFSSQMQEHKIKKIYRATVEGKVDRQETWKDYILKEDESGDDFHTVKVLAEASSPLPPDAKDCITTIIPLESFTKSGQTYTKCEFQIETGRQHQIRAQSAFHSHPLANDLAYGAKPSTQQFDLSAIQILFPPNELKIPESIICQ